MKKSISALLACACMQSFAATYTSYSWQAVNDDYSGSFSDSAHWTPVISTYPGAGYPDEYTGNINQKAVFPRVDADYTITMPQGVVTNIASFEMKAQYGHKVTINGSNTTLVMPTITLGSGVFGDMIFRVGSKDANGNPKDGGTFFKNEALNTATGFGTFKNFTVDLSSHVNGVPGTKLEFTGDYDWTGGALRYFFDAGDADGRAEISFKDGHMVKFPAFQLAFASPTNIISFSNFSGCVDNNIAWQPWSGCVANEVVGLFEWNMLNGSVLTNSNWGNMDFNLGYSYSAQSKYSTSKTFRVNIKDGSVLKVAYFKANYTGRYEVNVEGAGSKLDITHTTQLNSFSATASSTSTVRVVDGAYMRSADSVPMGGATVADAASSWADFIVSNATFVLRRDLRLGVGRIKLVNGADVTLYGSETDCRVRGLALGDVTEELIADGATFHFTQTSSLSPIYGFSAAKVGPKGLTVSAEGNKGYALAQELADLDAENGGVLEILSRASYPFTLATNSSVAKLVVGRETVKLAPGCNHNSFLVVTNGATFSLVDGPTAITLKGFTLGDAASVGTLALKAGDEVTVTGPMNFVNPQITFSTTLSSGTHTVFRSAVEPTAASVEYWEAFGRTLVTSGLPPGYNTFAVVESGGEWLFQVTAGATQPTYDGEATWAGPGSAWETAANWTDSTKPTAYLGAKFAGANPKTVTVPADATAVALTFVDSEGYTLTGGKVKLSDTASSAIAVTAGTNTVGSSVQYSMKTPVTVADGASLTLTGRNYGSGFTKSGAGTLALSSPQNMFSEGWTLNGGWLKATGPAALGYLSDIVTSTLTAGTLEIEGAGSTALKMAINGSVVYKPEADVTMPLPSATAGVIQKRGAGTLTFEASADTTLALTNSANFTGYANGDSYPYPGDGSAIGKYGAITVSEGELVIRGTGATVPTVTLKSGSSNQNMILGVPGAGHSGGTAKQPGLVIDHAKLAGQYLYVGSGITASDSFVTDPYIIVTNSGSLNISLTPGNNNSEMKGLHVYGNNATITALPDVNVRDGAGVTNHYTFIDSHVYSSRTASHGSAVMAFTNSTFAWSYDATDRSKWKVFNFAAYSMSYAGEIDMTFSQGSVLAIDYFGYTAPLSSQSFPFVLTFDDSEWWAGTGDATLATSNLNVRTVSVGGGLIQQTETGKTWRWISPVEGPGGFVKRGAGKVFFDTQIKYHQATADTTTLQYTGLTDIQAGTLQIANGAVSNIVARAFRVAGTLNAGGNSFASPVIESAGGTVANAELVTPTVKVAVDAEGATTPVTFDYANGCLVTGKVFVDFCRADDDPLTLHSTLTVANWTGTKPDVSLWRSVNCGKDLICTFTANDNGTITATVDIKGGLLFFLR